MGCLVEVQLGELIMFGNNFPMIRPTKWEGPTKWEDINIKQWNKSRTWTSWQQQKQRNKDDKHHHVKKGDDNKEQKHQIQLQRCTHSITRYCQTCLKKGDLRTWCQPKSSIFKGKHASSEEHVMSFKWYSLFPKEHRTNIQLSTPKHAFITNIHSLSHKYSTNTIQSWQKPPGKDRWLATH